MKQNPGQPADALQTVGLTGQNAAELRRRAEEKLQRQRPTDGGRRTELEAVRLVHELEVHQIELEMQNEQLQHTRAQAETLLAQYTDLYDFAPTGYLTLDRDGAILAVNLTGARLIGIERSQLIHRRLGYLVSGADRPAFNAFLKKTFAGEVREFCEVAFPRVAAEPLVVRIEAEAAEGRRECRVALLDVTDRHRAAAERERLIQELQTALARVKALSGLLPICANCKNIRDDQGYWKQVEAYISSHSEATFTHSLCPNCVPKLFPELDGTAPQPATAGLPHPADVTNSTWTQAQRKKATP